MLKKAMAMGFAALIGLGGAANAEDNHIDTIRSDAPELAQYGKFSVGVKTLKMTNPKQLDILKAKAGEPIPSYDRPLAVEVWYPAKVVPGQAGAGQYRAITRDGKSEVTLYGRAVRDAPPDATGGPYPLLIISHGYPGNRYLLSHLGENLSSKGYVVVSIDHTDSTYSDQAAFGSTLLNRPLDQLFVLNEMARLNTNDPEMDIPGMVEFSNLRPLDQHVVYVPFYMPGEHPKFSEPNGAFIDKVKRYLRKINPDLTDGDFIDTHTSRYRYAQPICDPGYLDKLPPMALPVKGLWVADTSYYYPEDRGISESIGFGRKMAREVAR